MEEKKLPIGIEPNTSKHQDIIVKVCRAHGIKSLDLTTKHIALMSDCINEYIAQHPASGPVWVKEKDRLPGWNQPVRWRLGKGPETERKIALSEMTNSYGIENWQWLDESGTPSESPAEQPVAKKINREWINEALVEFVSLYHKSTNKDIANDAAEYLNDKLKEIGIEYISYDEEKEAPEQPVREVDAEGEFAEWAATIAFFDDGTRLWELLGEGEAINGQFRFTTKEFYDIFQQQKPGSGEKEGENG